MKTIYLDTKIARLLAVQALKHIYPGVVFTALSPLQCQEVVFGKLPGPRWVRVKNRLSGICGSDLHMIYPHIDPKIAPLALPGNKRIFLGHEMVGEIVECGDSVRALRVGDRVVFRGVERNCWVKEVEPACRQCATGNYALCENASAYEERVPADRGGGWGEEFIAHESQLYPVPASLTDEEAVFIEPLACAVRAVLKGRPANRSRVLVVGTGTIGLLVIYVLKQLYTLCDITAISRYDFQKHVALALGADRVLSDNAELYDDVSKITEGKLYKGYAKNCMILGGFDVVYDCVGSDSTINHSLRWTRAGGTVVIVGLNFKPGHIDYTPIWYQEVNLVGVVGHGREEINNNRESTFDISINILSKKIYDITSLITHRFTLDSYRLAIETAMHKSNFKTIKVIFDNRHGASADQKMTGGSSPADAEDRGGT